MLPSFEFAICPSHPLQICFPPKCQIFYIRVQLQICIGITHPLAVSPGIKMVSMVPSVRARLQWLKQLEWTFVGAPPRKRHAPSSNCVGCDGARRGRLNTPSILSSRPCNLKFLATSCLSRRVTLQLGKIASTRAIFMARSRPKLEGPTSFLSFGSFGLLGL